MDKDARRAAIEIAETVVGSSLPERLRELLINEGEVRFAPPDGVGADPIFRLSSNPDGAALFADQQGKEMSELRSWDNDADGWEYTEKAFLALENGCGDSVLLAPDQSGIARKFVFCNHETGELELWSDDVEKLLHHPDEDFRESADELAVNIPESAIAAAVHTALRRSGGSNDLNREQLAALLEQAEISPDEIEDVMVFMGELGIEINDER
ncbi:hypothetical protein [Yoonia sp. SDW83-1]|uniref:hypothetical protein n=1 Tax=Yoonia sp. SDW83-1 TaxID=3366945 RepID=UPI00398C2F6F